MGVDTDETRKRLEESMALIAGRTVPVAEVVTKALWDVNAIQILLLGLIDEQRRTNELLTEWLQARDLPAEAYTRGFADGRKRSPP